MGRRKVPMALISDRRIRVSTFGKRKEGLKKKANELSVLCGVEVALVVAPADGEVGAAAAKADVWESKEGVLARYRELDDVDGGAGILLEGISPLSSAPLDDAYLQLHVLGGNGDDANDQAMAMWGNNGFHHPYTSTNVQYGFQQFNSSNIAMDGYDQQQLQMVPGMYNNGGLATDAYHYQTRHAGTMQHSYAFPCASYFGMPSGGYQMQQVIGSGAAQLSLAMPSADESCHAMVALPVVEYPSADTSLNYMDTQATHGVHDGSGGTSFSMDARGNFINAPPAFSVAMSTGDGGGSNFISAPPAAPSHTMGCTGTSDDFTPAQPISMSYGGDMTIAGRYATRSGM